MANSYNVDDILEEVRRKKERQAPAPEALSRQPVSAAGRSGAPTRKNTPPRRPAGGSPFGTRRTPPGAARPFSFPG